MKNMNNISGWLPLVEAKALKAELIASGEYGRGEVKLSSYKWVDIKDHSKGYLARVVAKQIIIQDTTKCTGSNCTTKIYRVGNKHFVEQFTAYNKKFETLEFNTLKDAKEHAFYFGLANCESDALRW
jgi:hypothetical protein